MSTATKKTTPTFDKAAHIEKMKPHADKLIKSLKAAGVEFQANDGENNVVFTCADAKVKRITISHHSFYRFSGMCCIYKHGKKEDNTVKITELTDAMFMNSLMKACVEIMLNPPEKQQQNND